MANDVYVEIEEETGRATVVGGTPQGEEFIDAWGFGVLSVEDVGRVTVTREVVNDLADAAVESGLVVETRRERAKKEES